MEDNSLRRLRKAAGWPTAKAFADSIGVPAPTYARYEQSGDGPETNIPMKAAFTIADALGCSIDALVGREQVSPDALRGEVQRRYDALSPDGKQLVEDFLSMAEMREGRAEEQRLAELAKVYMKDARKYELKYLDSLEAAFGEEDFHYIGAAENMRRGFETFAYNEVTKADERSVESRCRLRAHIIEQQGAVYKEVPGKPQGERIEKSDDGFEEAVAMDLASFRSQMEEGSEDRIKEVMEGIMAAYDSMHPDREGKIDYAIVHLNVER